MTTCRVLTVVALLGLAASGSSVPLSIRAPLPPSVGTWASQHVLSRRVSVPLLKMLDQMLANGCFDVFTAEEE